jgi:hypothetical protein
VALDDDHVDELLEQAISHVEHVRVGLARTSRAHHSPNPDPMSTTPHVHRDHQHDRRRHDHADEHDDGHSAGMTTTMATPTAWSTTPSSAAATASARCSSPWPCSASPPSRRRSIFALSGSVALLANLIHNFGDSLTAVPLGIAFLPRSVGAEHGAGLFVVAAIFISAAAVAGVGAVRRLIEPTPPDHLWVLAAAGAIGYLGNIIAAQVGTRAGNRLNSPAIVADGDHARAHAYVSLAVIVTAAVVAIGQPIADPLIDLAITLVILRITCQSWATVRGYHRH